MTLKVDSKRKHYVNKSGILVRALDTDGQWKNIDIAFLDRQSLSEWLRSRGGKNEWAESVVMMLLGYSNEN